MDDERIVAVRTQYQSRPGRRAIVVLDLADLQGPTEGIVELPPPAVLEAGRPAVRPRDPGTRRYMYQTVLREAIYPEELTTYLDGATLIALWPQLHLPKGVRQAWEE